MEVDLDPRMVPLPDTSSDEDLLGVGNEQHFDDEAGANPLGDRPDVASAERESAATPPVAEEAPQAPAVARDADEIRPVQERSPQAPTLSRDTEDRPASGQVNRDAEGGPPPPPARANTSRDADIDLYRQIADRHPNPRNDPIVNLLKSALRADVDRMVNARADDNDEAYDAARTQALQQAGQLQNTAIAERAHGAGQATAKAILYAAIPGLVALIPSSIIAANNQTDRNKTVAGDNNG